MTPVSTIEGKAYPFGLKNIDTDVIIPAHWLKTIDTRGLGRGAFEFYRKNRAICSIARNMQAPRS